MTKSVAKITLSASRDITFDKLVLSQSNVRRIKAGVSIEELAEDIARRTLLQSLTVRPVLDADGAETGVYEIPAGGRRYRALELLVRQKRLAKTAPVPCVIRLDGVAEEDSLAENIQRAPLHPLDQFRAFLTLREKGQSEEEIAAAFFVAPAVVRQRLRLASVSPKLLDVYAEDGITLDQLMAFTISGDHERQEQVFERLAQSYCKEPYQIRRMLTEGSARMSDKRAQFVGLQAYEDAGGVIMRDLFQGDDGGWLQDPVLLNILVARKLDQAAEAIRSEGWKWIEVAPDFPYGHVYGLRQLTGEQMPLSEEQQSAREALQLELERLEQAYAADEELPDDVDQRVGELETAIAVFDDRPMIFDPDELSRAGAFVSIGPSGELKVERGFVRPEDEAPILAQPEVVDDLAVAAASTMAARVEEDGETIHPATPAAEPEEDEGLQPISDRLVSELTAHRTLALRGAVGERPDIALRAVLHCLCLQLFYRYAVDSCLELTAKSVVFTAQAPGLNDSRSATSVEARHRAWSAQMPKDCADLWDTLVGWDEDSRQALFSHCVAQTLNAVQEPWNRRTRALAHADKLAQAVNLRIDERDWTATAESFLGRVTKARIVQSVREARGEASALRIEPLKKDAMVQAAAELLAGSGWLPEPLRTPGLAAEAAQSSDVTSAEPDAASTVEETARIGGESAIDPEASQDEDWAVAETAVVLAAE